ncbi:MAG TPA: hypothetical protein VL486_01750 [Verrucomicrobiae bacterium]|nr:hypothetical protein [Verrucomicrobiae bacterium]
MSIPATKSEYLELVGRETARMSYPGSMSRGEYPIVKKGTKQKLEDFFAKEFPMSAAWTDAANIANAYEKWHAERSNEISAAIESCVWKPNVSQCVAAKFLNTFMHQLMKYEASRPLWKELHLPLDSRVFASLKKERCAALADVQAYFWQSPYQIPYEAHLKVQAALRKLLDELNERPQAEFKFASRIELNLLWL